MTFYHTLCFSYADRVLLTPMRMKLHLSGRLHVVDTAAVHRYAGYPGIWNLVTVIDC
jgi:hypothetical protein